VQLVRLQPEKLAQWVLAYHFSPFQVAVFHNLTDVPLTAEKKHKNKFSHPRP